MANLNKVTLIGRLTRDPEVKTFTNGGKVANIGFAVNNRRKNQQTGQWEGKEDGKKQSKMRVVVDDFQFLEKREDGGRTTPSTQNSPAKTAEAGGDGIEEVPF